ncbi:hypothetical protein [Marinitenerispora sediminis]|uniref:Uncharacterized protein n=1 Tax=Marinitenerispora sediminis TaxID=1931232 RepID=A0A368T6Z6_9ACTN|nr:hypothetical protein [Marinitenerispora sediminis]RCV49448.1 hypothetical protein DEF28_20810 [Marinitenerispora sediminis]RCV50514.1 hypothetical protein DEF23_21910 [Marinitenerispora sediminis]RCV56806.1 hypothetical protein DEF24_16120 [Marinitenerispora sediminis]
MERCVECERLGVAEYRISSNGDRVWVCEECDAMWREGDDRRSPCFADILRYLAESGLTPAALAPVRAPAAAAPPYQRAWRALRDLLGEGRLSVLRVGGYAAEARDAVGPWGPAAPPLNAAQVIPPEPGPVRLRLSGGVVVELAVEVPGGPLELPGALEGEPGPDFGLLSRADVESVLRRVGARVSESPEGLRFDTGRFGGEVAFDRDRPCALRVRPA